jgi:DNA repair exonuclease SbcCD ATPase subunit
MHQLNMRFTVSALRDRGSERRRDKAETPTVKTPEQAIADEAAKAKNEAKEAERRERASQSIWRRKFRPLPEPKAVDLFADVIGDSFILGIASILIVYEYIRSSRKPDKNAMRMEELESRLGAERRRIEELESQLGAERRRIEELEALEKQRQARMSTLEEAVEGLQGARTAQTRVLPL